MKIISNNRMYDFKMDHHPLPDDLDPHMFLINFRVIRSRITTHVSTLPVSREVPIFFEPCMLDLLKDEAVPPHLQSDFAKHFKFRLDRLNRVQGRCSGGVSVSVDLEVTEMSGERAEAMRVGRINSLERRVRGNMEEVGVSKPAKKWAVDGLERVKDGGDGECSICLERYEDDEVIKMPCSHVFHNACLVEWLNKTHCCPLCRFHLPSS